MPKFLRYGAALLTVAVLGCLAGFAIAGGPGRPGSRPFMYGMLVCFGVMALAAAYMAAVGAYHTFLAVFGLDGGPGILRKNKHYVPGSDEPLPDGTPVDPGKQ